MKETDSIIPNELTDEVMLSDLQQLLDEELAKPEKERDLDAIKEITAAMVEIADVQPPPPPTEKIIGAAAERRRKKIGHIRRWATALSACFVVGIALNFYTLATYGENIIEAVLKRTRSGYSIDLSRMNHNDERDPAKPPKEEHDPKSTGTMWYDPFLPWLSITTETTASHETTGTVSDNSGTAPDKMVNYIADSMKKVCGEHNIVPFVPSELPSEMEYNGFFELKESHYEAMEDSEDIDLVFSNDNQQQFKITLEKYKSEEDLPEILIPSDNTDYLEGEERGTHVYAFPNRNRVTAVFVHENITYTITGYNISADAIMKLAYSFVPSDSDIK